MDKNATSEYRWLDASLSESHSYLLPVLLRELDRLRTVNPTAKTEKLFDLGCGNGSVARVLAQRGWDVTGVDPSAEGIAQANAHYPDLKLYQGSSYDDLAERFGKFSVVTSLEVVEHVCFPRQYAATLFSLLSPGGTGIISTPYHGYLKNLVLALTGKMDAHFTALWDNGHIKFWSMKTLGQLLREAGFINIHFQSAGRVPSLAKSMIALARKP